MLVKVDFQIISRQANTMKNQADEKTLLAFARGVLDRHSKGGFARAG